MAAKCSIFGGHDTKQNIIEDIMSKRKNTKRTLNHDRNARSWPLNPSSVFCIRYLLTLTRTKLQRQNISHNFATRKNNEKREKKFDLTNQRLNIMV